MSSSSSNLDWQTCPSKVSFISKSNGTSSTSTSTGTNPDVNPDSQEIQNDFAVNPDDSVFFLSSPPVMRKNSCTTKSLWVWNHYKRPTKKKDTQVFCLLCENNVFYTASCSTGLLERHVKRHHLRFFQEALKSGAKKVPKLSEDGPRAQPSVKGFMDNCPNFEPCPINWAVETYQPLWCCEEQSSDLFVFH